jgi:hypothetical protein
VKRLIANICVACAVLAFGSPAQASSITIDFDDHGLSTGDAIGNFYQYLGVTFMDATIHPVLSGSYFSDPDAQYSGPNGVVHSTSGGSPQPADPIEALFDYDVSSVSLTGLSVGIAGFLFTAYDALGNVLDTAQAIGWGVNGTCPYCFFTLSLEANGIRRVEFSQLRSASDFHTGDAAYWDNLAFTPTPVSVPEPGTLSLLGVGLFGLLSTRRGRSARTH